MISSLKKIFYCGALSIALCNLIHCSGGGADPFEAVPNESPSADLLGEWSFEATITDSTCEEIFSIGESTDYVIAIEQSSSGEYVCGFTDWDDDGDIGLGVEFECEAGADIVVLTAETSYDDPDTGCSITYQELYTLQADSPNELSGTFSIAFEMNAACGSSLTSCDVSGTVVGEPWTTSSASSDDASSDEEEVEEEDDDVANTSPDASEETGSETTDAPATDTPTEDGSNTDDTDTDVAEAFTGNATLTVVSQPEEYSAGMTFTITATIDNQTNVDDLLVDVTLRESQRITLAPWLQNQTPTRINGVGPFCYGENAACTYLDTVNAGVAAGNTLTAGYSFTLPTDIETGRYWMTVRLKYQDAEGTTRILDVERNRVEIQ